MDHLLGKSFPKSFVKGGYLFGIAGSIIIALNTFKGEYYIANYFVGLLFIALGLFFSLTSYGIEIYRETKTYREYTKFLGMKFGKTKALSKFAYISIVKAEHGVRMYSRSNRSISVSDKKYDVSFYTKSFRQRVLLKMCDTEEDAKKFAIEMVKETGLVLSKYNPSKKNS